MANYFALYPKGSNQPAILQDVDAKMRDHFKQPQDPDAWLSNWYTVIGCLIAVKGAALHTQRLRELILDWFTSPPYSTLVSDVEASQYFDDMILILDWLEAHYTSENWASIGKAS